MNGYTIYPNYNPNSNHSKSIGTENLSTRNVLGGRPTTKTARTQTGLHTSTQNPDTLNLGGDNKTLLLKKAQREARRAGKPIPNSLGDVEGFVDNTPSVDMKDPETKAYLDSVNASRTSQKGLMSLAENLMHQQNQMVVAEMAR